MPVLMSFSRIQGKKINTNSCHGTLPFKNLLKQLLKLLWHFLFRHDLTLDLMLQELNFPPLLLKEGEKNYKVF